MLLTKYIKHKIDLVPGSSPLCSKSHSETTDHILNGCAKLSQTVYKARHDKVSAAVHWSLDKEYGFDHSSKFYERGQKKSKKMMVPNSCGTFMCSRGFMCSRTMSSSIAWAPQSLLSTKAIGKKQR